MGLGVSRRPRDGIGPPKGACLRSRRDWMADTAGGAPEASEESHHSRKQGLMTLAVGSVGVVFGDIGTSPLYAMREALSHSREGLSHDAVLGVVSLIFWALIVIVTIKYVVFVMRADNKGEGGTLAL